MNMILLLLIKILFSSSKIRVSKPICLHYNNSTGIKKNALSNIRSSIIKKIQESRSVSKNSSSSESELLPPFSPNDYTDTIITPIKQNDNVFVFKIQSLRSNQKEYVLKVVINNSNHYNFESKNFNIYKKSCNDKCKNIVKCFIAEKTLMKIPRKKEYDSSSSDSSSSSSMGMIREACRNLLYEVKEEWTWMLFEHLNVKIPKRRLLSEPIIKKILKDTLKGIKRLHDIGYAHLDVKIDNIMGYSDLQVNLKKNYPLPPPNEITYKLIDFGLTQRWEKLEDGKRLQSSIGTHGYMSPEILNSNIYGRHSDIWALGCVALYLTSSEKNCRASETDRLKEFSEYVDKRSCKNKVINIKKLDKVIQNSLPVESFSEEMNQFIADCLQTDYNNRPSARDLLKHSLFTSKPTPHANNRKSSYKNNKDSKYYFLFIITVIIIAIAFLLYILYNERTN